MAGRASAQESRRCMTNRSPRMSQAPMFEGELCTSEGELWQVT